MSKGHVEIAGAGLAGLTAAAAFAQAGWSVRVHERGDELREIGAGIFLWENSLKVLEAIGAYAGATEGGERDEYWEIRDERQRLLQSGWMMQGSRLITVLRSKLHGALAHPPRILQPAGRAIDLAHVARIDSDIRGELHRAFHALGRLDDAPAPIGNDTCEMQHMRMGGRGGENPFGQRIRLLQPAFALQPGDFAEHLAQRDLLPRLRRGGRRHASTVHAACRTGCS